MDATQESLPNYEFARSIALRLLTTRDRSSSELTELLRKRRVPDDVIDEVLSRFRDVGLVDDDRFAQAWVDSGLRRHRSSRVLAQELHRKGIDRDVAREAVSSVSADDELAIARTLALKRLASMGSVETPVAQRRLIGVLMRRGFPSAIVAAAVRDALTEVGKPEDMHEFD